MPSTDFRTSQRFGECKKLKSCPPNQLFYPEKNECHDILTQGPCLNGKLLYVDENSIPKCMVSSFTLFAVAGYVFNSHPIIVFIERSTCEILSP